MHLEVRKVKSFTGMEGLGFNADLYAGGKKVAFVIDEGCGGSYLYRWEGKTPAERAANEATVAQVIEALPPEPMPADAEEWEESLYPDGQRIAELESFLAGLVDDFLSNRKLERQKRTAIPFKTMACESGSYYLLKHKGDVEGTKAHILKKHPDAVFL